MLITEMPFRFDDLEKMTVKEVLRKVIANGRALC